MSGLWLLGVIALTLVPSSPDGERDVSFRHQATGMTIAYHDVNGRFTVYVRGSQRVIAAQ